MLHNGCFVGDDQFSYSRSDTMIHYILSACDGMYNLLFFKRIQHPLVTDIHYTCLWVSIIFTMYSGFCSRVCYCAIVNLHIRNVNKCTYLVVNSFLM
jgi:hypothetical protein